VPRHLPLTGKPAFVKGICQISHKLAAPAPSLADLDPEFAALMARVGPCRLARRPENDPYQALLRAVTYQQLHGRAAAAIYARLLALFPGHPCPPPALLLDCPTPLLRGCGLSAAKVLAVKDIAAKALDGIVPDAAAAQRMSDDSLIDCLTTLRGVGRWTVEMMLIFALGRPDILPVDDFAVRQGYRKWQGLDQAPSPKRLAEIGRAWSPHRSTAAWYLWRASEWKA
jgi:DNA-3-methyladenine glycosylase II